MADSPERPYSQRGERLPIAWDLAGHPITRSFSGNVIEAINNHLINPADLLSPRIVKFTGSVEAALAVNMICWWSVIYGEWVGIPTYGLSTIVDQNQSETATDPDKKELERRVSVERIYRLLQKGLVRQQEEENILWWLPTERLVQEIERQERDHFSQEIFANQIDFRLRQRQNFGRNN